MKAKDSDQSKVDNKESMVVFFSFLNCFTIFSLLLIFGSSATNNELIKSFATFGSKDDLRLRFAGATSGSLLSIFSSAIETSVVMSLNTTPQLHRQ